MLNNTYSAAHGPDMNLTERDGLDGLPIIRPRLPGMTGGINPNNMYTGGNLPGTLLNLGGGSHGIPVPPNTGGNLPPTLHTMSTGGNLPPTLHTMSTGGNLPPNIFHPPTLPPSDPSHQVPGMQTGGNLPPQVQPPAVHTGGNLPPQQQQQQATLQSILQSLWAATGGAGNQPNPAALANKYMASILGSNSPYMQNARQQGLALANSRGLLNSGMAAGNAQQAAIQAAQPLFNAAYGLNSQRENNTFQGNLDRFNQGMNLLGQRENNAFQGNESQLNRNFQGDQNQLNRNLQSKLQSDSTFQQDWLNSQNFNRSFYANMAMVPVASAAQFQQMIAQYALDNPEVYTPETIAGMTQFFNSNFQQIMAQYMPNIGGT
jgi:hypothetical protein